jgi:neutral ceramidase
MSLDRRQFLAAVAGAAALQPSPAPDWRVGLAAIDITPSPGVWMAGYAARTMPADGTSLPLHAKAAAFEDADGRTAVLVTLDLLGLTGPVVERIATAVQRRHGLSRDALLLCSSHTHSGPVIDDQLAVAYDLTPAQWDAVRESTRRIEGQVVDVVGRALDRRQPARLGTAQGEAGFAANRRTQFTPDGPVDHAVPVLSIERPDGSLAGLLFLYACHNTTLPAEWTRYHGDYAGVAQAELERRHPGVTAMFVTGCGADANPRPRGTEALVTAHGRALADAVDRARSDTQPVRGALRSAFARCDLAYAPAAGAAHWTGLLDDENVYVQRHARLMLDVLAREGALPASEPAPVHVLRLGAMDLVTLGGEVVVDYARAVKAAHGDRVWVAGYTDEVFGYVPSERILREGGYEGGGAMLYYGRPGPFAEGVEAALVNTIARLMRATAA